MDRFLRELGEDLAGFEDELGIDLIEETELDSTDEEATGNAGGHANSSSAASSSHVVVDVSEFPEWRENWIDLLKNHHHAMRDAVLAEHDEEGEVAVERVLYPILNRLHETYWNCTGELDHAINDVAEESALFDPAHRVIAKKFMLLAILTIPDAECSIIRDLRNEWYEVDPGFRTFVNVSEPIAVKVGKSEDIEDFVKSFVMAYRTTCLTHVPPSIVSQ